MNVQVSAPVVRSTPQDNVVVACREITAGVLIASEGVAVTETVPAGYKVAIRAISVGEAIVKRGSIVGFAARDISVGSLVHSHNVCFDLVEPVHTSKVDIPFPILAEAERARFEGIVRENGRIGTRNFIGVFIVGNCGATAARQVADWFNEDELAEYPNVDGVVPFIHEMGCGMEMTGEPMNLLRRAISGFIRNPNIAGAVVIALGCERNNLGIFLEQEKLIVGECLKTVTIQEVGGMRNAVEIAKRYVKEMLPEANRIRRQTVSAEHLTVALQSSTQDGFSGLTANSVLGIVADMVVRNGGTVILSETPELLWVESQVVARAVKSEVAEKFRMRLDWWRNHSKGRDTEITGRLSRASHAAGVSTPLEKSVDSLMKAGTSPLTGAYEYAHPINDAGLVFMDTPDFDAISITGQIAGGATLVAMTTGTGTTVGSLPAPTLKFASNGETYKRASADIDCGAVLDAKTNLEDLARQAFETLLCVASGQRTQSEVECMGEGQFVPWSIGVLA
ncbi:altronate dehydratase [Agrobacterium rhizogenes]|uniref:UxaA family hydrolase n=1 Tax=Rhizobium rhizogenes TaxID=359 RepID=UPI001574453F|nr:UxaA family hydrolase [Rhizobium rhizogenes]NTH16782.1 altronate dehydratase [Rhizobium rhizogenes]